MRAVSVLLMLAFPAFAAGDDEEEEGFFARHRGPIVAELLAATFAMLSPVIVGYGADLESRSVRARTASGARVIAAEVPGADGRPYMVAGAGLVIVSLAMAFAGVIWLMQQNGSE